MELKGAGMSDVVVWMDTGSGPWVTPCVRALKLHLKGKSPWRWHLAGSQRTKVERLAYDLGLIPVFCHEDQLSSLGDSLTALGPQPYLVVSDRLILTADWTPGPLGQWKVWPNLRVWFAPPNHWEDSEFQPSTWLPEQQVLRLKWTEYEARQGKSSLWGGPKALWITG